MKRTENVGCRLDVKSADCAQVSNAGPRLSELPQFFSRMAQGLPARHSSGRRMGASKIDVLSCGLAALHDHFPDPY